MVRMAVVVPAGSEQEEGICWCQSYMKNFMFGVAWNLQGCFILRLFCLSAEVHFCSVGSWELNPAQLLLAVAGGNPGRPQRLP